MTQPMSLSQALADDGVFASIAQELDTDETTARTAASALLPAIVAGMGRQQAGGSLDGPLGGAMGGGIGGVLLDQVLGRGSTPTAPGNDILGQIFGNKDVSRGVAEEVSGSTGIPSALIKKMLPILVMAVVGQVMKKQGGGAGGALGGILGQVLGGLARR